MRRLSILLVLGAGPFFATAAGAAHAQRGPLVADRPDFTPSTRRGTIIRDAAADSPPRKRRRERGWRLMLALLLKARPRAAGGTGPSYRGRSATGGTAGRRLGCGSQEPRPQDRAPPPPARPDRLAPSQGR